MSDNDPWLPPGHAERLTVGARVRVNLSGECSIGGRHGSREDGATGMVISDDSKIGNPLEGHPYCVWFHQPFTRPLMRSWFYAAAELEPIP